MRDVICCFPGRLKAAERTSRCKEITDTANPLMSICLQAISYLWSHEFVEQSFLHEVTVNPITDMPREQAKHRYYQMDKHREKNSKMSTWKCIVGIQTSWKFFFVFVSLLFLGHRFH